MVVYLWPCPHMVAHFHVATHHIDHVVPAVEGPLHCDRPERVYSDDMFVVKTGPERAARAVRARQPEQRPVSSEDTGVSCVD